MSAEQKSPSPIPAEIVQDQQGHVAGNQILSRRSWSGPVSRRILIWVIVATTMIGAGVYVRAGIYRRISDYTHLALIYRPVSGGTLLIAGGGDLSDLIRYRFIELAGGSAARIVVIPAEVIDEESRQQYRNAWSRFQVSSVSVLHTTSRELADDPAFSDSLQTATGVWLGGGQQSSLAAWYCGTLVELRLKEVLARNGVVGGTSAGAAIMSGVMIAGGRGEPRMGRGFDLIPGAVIDQHFIKRNRIGRLYQVLERNPELIGFGVDEGTALQYSLDSGHFEVLGQSCVVACLMDPETPNQGKFRLQFLNPGDEFDVRRLRRGETVQPSFTDFDALLFGE